jgi:hypothetical protein
MNTAELISNLAHPLDAASRQTLFQGVALTNKNLVFDIQKQKYDRWCWAAVASSVSLFYWKTSPWSQCEVASRTRGRTDCCQTPTPDSCNQDEYLEHALAATSNLNQKIINPVPFSTIQAEIDANRVVGARIDWHGRSGHFVVIYGYSTVGSQQQVSVGDPSDASSCVIPFDEFTSNYQGMGTWNRTYLTQSYLPTVNLRFATISDELLSGIRRQQAERAALSVPSTDSAPAANVGVGHAIYNWKLDDLMENKPPTFYALRALELKTSPPTSAFVLDQERKRILGHTTSIQRIGRFFDALGVALKLPPPEPGAQWEVAVLDVHSLNATFLWLRHGDGTKDQLISLNDFAGQVEMKAVPFAEAVEKLKAAAARTNREDPEVGGA